jgi:hypothetical protein
MFGFWQIYMRLIRRPSKSPRGCKSFDELDAILALTD